MTSANKSLEKRIFLWVGNVIKQLVLTSAVRPSRYEALGKFGERSRSLEQLLYAPFVLSKHPACFISRWTHADIWTIAKSQLTWIRIPSLTWRTVKSSLLAPYSGLVHRGVSRGIKRRLIQVPNGIIFPSFLWEMHPHILLHNLRVTHATRILSVVYLF